MDLIFLSLIILIQEILMKQLKTKFLYLRDLLKDKKQLKQKLQKKTIPKLLFELILMSSI